MKAYHLIALTIGVISIVKASVINGQNICSGYPNGAQIPNNGDCGSYYVCNHGQPALFECKGNLLYDHDAHVCNWPEYVTCAQVIGKPPIVYPDPPTSGNEGEGIPEHPYPNVDGSPENNPQQPQPEQPPGPPPRPTPAPLPPIPEVQTQEYWPGIEVTIGSNPQLFACTRSGFYFAPHPSNCEQYFICENYNIHKHQCGAGIHWDYIFAQCDYPQRSFCYSKGVSDISFDEPSIPAAELPLEITTTTITTPIFEHVADPIPQCPVSQAFFAHPLDCHKYYICIGGIPIMTSCPDHLVWDAELSQCGDPDTNSCSTIVAKK